MNPEKNLIQKNYLLLSTARCPGFGTTARPESPNAEPDDPLERLANLLEGVTVGFLS